MKKGVYRTKEMVTFTISTSQTMRPEATWHWVKQRKHEDSRACVLLFHITILDFTFWAIH